jgi:quinol monooxygenase YgiN
MVQLHLRLKAPPGRRPETVQALRALRFPAQLTGGCASSDICCELDDPDVLLYVEEWPGLEDFVREVHSDRFSRLLALMETAAEAPALEFRFVQQTRGLDYIAEVRGEHAPSR